MESLGQNVFIFLQHYGYWVMLPLMVIEGPITTVIAALLASLGAFNVFIVFLFSILGDLIGDITFYALGYKFGMSFVRKIGKYVGITEKVVLKMEKYFIHHGGKTIFVAKSTVGLCLATFIAAGITKMNFKKFLKYVFLGGLVWSGFLVAMGYFYGYLWREIKKYIEWAGWIAVALAIVTFLMVTLYKSQKTKKLFNNNSSLKNEKK